MHMTSWNLHLVNVQKAARSHIWDLNAMIIANTSPEGHTTPCDTLDDLVRIPANSKSRFDLEEQNSAQQQLKQCNSFLFSAGVNRDLFGAYSGIRAASPIDPYAPPVKQANVIAQSPESLATDLYACSTCQEDISTVEDKDPKRTLAHAQR